MYNLIIVDDEKIYREGVTRVISGLGDFEVFNATNGLEALDIIRGFLGETRLMDKMRF